MPLQWRLLLQTMGKAGKGTAWAEYKLESVLTVPSLISESVIMEDDDGTVLGELQIDLRGHARCKYLAHRVKRVLRSDGRRTAMPDYLQ